MCDVRTGGVDQRQGDAMTTIHLHTTVYDNPGTPLGLLGRSQRVVHFCDTCRSEIATGDLTAHARAHGEPARWWEVAEDGGANP